MIEIRCVYTVFSIITVQLFSRPETQNKFGFQFIGPHRSQKRTKFDLSHVPVLVGGYKEIQILEKLRIFFLKSSIVSRGWRDKRLRMFWLP
jgi:hypothetical protein